MHQEEIGKTGRTKVTLVLMTRRFKDNYGTDHVGGVNGLTWTEDGASLISLGTDEKLRVWNILSGKNTLVRTPSALRQYFA